MSFPSNWLRPTCLRTIIIAGARFSSPSHASESRGKESMSTRHSAVRYRFVRFSSPLLLAALAFAGAGLVSSAAAQTPGQSTFNTPEEAVKALVAATKDENVADLQKLFGPQYTQLLSGDPVEDKRDLDDFSAAIQENAELVQVDGTKYTVNAGKDAWPSPIPVVQKDGKWFFDTAGGLDEVANRRIGNNELSAIETCRAYALAQWEYFTQSDWDHDGIAEYAKRLISSPGRHDGLYWETTEDENPSPLGVALAAAQARVAGSTAVTAAPSGAAGKSLLPQTAVALDVPNVPYHGYYFKILTGQGPHAPGGKYSYIINGNMIAGYALVAYPANWSTAGIMTFIINQQGRVYQKNLGPDTAKQAAAMTIYNPDATWELVQDQP